MFAFAYYAWSTENPEDCKNYPRLGKETSSYLTTFKAEVRNYKLNDLKL